MIYPKGPCDDLALPELLLGGGVLIAWAGSLLLGLMIPTNLLMNRLWSGEVNSFFVTMGYSLLILAGYALTNPLLLMCTSTVLGAMAQRWQVSDSLADVPSSAQYAAPRRFYFDAVLRGFFVYLLFIAGYILITDIRFDNATSFSFNAYVRIAGAASVLGFVVGYDPNLIVRFIQRVIEALPGVEVALAEPSPAGIPETQESARRKELSAGNETGDDAAT
jgi:hypothetical protein